MHAFQTNSIHDLVESPRSIQELGVLGTWDHNFFIILSPLFFEIMV